MQRIVIAAIAYGVCCLIAGAQEPADSNLGDRVDALAKAALALPIAGLSVAVARDGKVIFARGYGVANVEHSVAVTPDTVFHIASISKNILAAVVLQLVDQGKLDLDDDVTKYIPEAPTHGHRVTVRQLLNHTSGIYSFTSLPEADANERLDLTHDQILALIKDKPLDFEPGTGWRYSNSAFYIAGMIVERITKQEYAAYVREHIFKPLGMDSALMCDAQMVVPHLTSGYERDRSGLVNSPFMSWKLPWAAGAVCATATDLLKWQAALDSGRVLTALSLKTMRAPTTLSDGTVMDYGLGTRLGSVDGHRIIGHTGGGGGFGNALEDFPDDHVTVVVLMNTGSAAGRAVALATAIARPLLGLPEKKTIRDLTVPKGELGAVSATFESEEGTDETYESGGKLHFRNSVTHAEGAMLRQSEYVYAINEDIEVHFVVRDGRPVWSLVYIGGMMMDAGRRVR